MSATPSEDDAEISDGATETCWFCNPAVRVEDPPGGWIHEDSSWRVGHGLPGWGPAGTIIVESRRHFLDVSDMRPEEAATFGPLLADVVAAVKQVVHADRVYTWSTMDRFPHLHVWLIPWWKESASRGPEYLVHSLTGVGANEAEAVDVATTMRTLLSGRTVT